MVLSIRTGYPLPSCPKSDELLDKLPKLAEAYTWVIVDGPAALSETTRAKILGADLAIVPCQPTEVYLESAPDTIRLIQLLCCKDCKYATRRIEKIL